MPTIAANCEEQGVERVESEGLISDLKISSIAVTFTFLSSAHRCHYYAGDWAGMPQVGQCLSVQACNFHAAITKAVCLVLCEVPLCATSFCSHEVLFISCRSTMSSSPLRRYTTPHHIPCWSISSSVCYSRKALCMHYEWSKRMFIAYDCHAYLFIMRTNQSQQKCARQSMRSMTYACPHGSYASLSLMECNAWSSSHSPSPCSLAVCLQPRPITSELGEAYGLSRQLCAATETSNARQVLNHRISLSPHPYPPAHTHLVFFIPISFLLFLIIPRHFG